MCIYLCVHGSCVLLAPRSCSWRRPGPGGGGGGGNKVMNEPRTLTPLVCLSTPTPLIYLMPSPTLPCPRHHNPRPHAGALSLPTHLSYPDLSLPSVSFLCNILLNSIVSVWSAKPIVVHPPHSGRSELGNQLHARPWGTETVRNCTRR